MKNCDTIYILKYISNCLYCDSTELGNMVILLFCCYVADKTYPLQFSTAVLGLLNHRLVANEVFVIESCVITHPVRLYVSEHVYESLALPSESPYVRVVREYFYR